MNFFFNVLNFKWMRQEIRQSFEIINLIPKLNIEITKTKTLEKKIIFRHI